jgi:predicted 3-demethylubiquinone-9 3-methyltransferase (glyoxalase superfamily)
VGRLLIAAEKETAMAEIQKIATMLMFRGQAEEAMKFYTSLFGDSKIEFIEPYGKAYPGPKGQVVHARFRLNGQIFMATDSHVEQSFTFTPAMSLFVTCTDEPEIDRLFAALSREGKVLMKLGKYPFAAKYCWVQDRFGVSWQLMLA